MIQVSHVSKRYHASADVVRDVSFTIKEGCIFGLLGPNGAGKTTLMQMISTLLLPSSGDILIYGMNTKEEARRIRMKIGFLTSEVKLDPFSTPEKLFTFFGELYQLDRALVEQRKQESFARFNIEPFAQKKIIELSTGMKQKISIAISMIHDPSVVIFDEPTNGLDILTAHQVTDYLRELKTSGHIVLLSTHIFSVAQDLCDELAILIDGQIAAQGSVASLIEATGTTTFEEAFFHLYKQNHKE